MSDKKRTVRDTFAEADAVLEGRLAHSSDNITGAIVDDIREGFDIQNFSGFWPDELTPVRSNQHRAHLKSRGFRPLDPEVDQEIVVAAPGCEVWIRSNKAKAAATKDRRDFARCEGRWDGKGGNRFGARTWKTMQKNRQIGSRHWD